VFLGVDIGTSSSKAVVTNVDGQLIAQTVRPHATSSPRSGYFEHEPTADWWDSLVVLCQSLHQQGVNLSALEALSVSGIGPCTLVTTGDSTPLRPAILYGIDTRATEEIAEITSAIGNEIVDRCGNPLSSQSVLPKLRWIARHEPGAFARARRWYCCSSWLTEQLTGEYVIDHYTASVADPLYDLGTHSWWNEVWAEYLPAFQQPRLAWTGELVAGLRPSAASALGLSAGLPVFTGTIDAFSEAFGAGVRQPGDTMVMYGSTMFFIQVTSRAQPLPSLWAASGRTAATNSLAAGLSTAGLLATWFKGVVNVDEDTIFHEAAAAPAGSNGLVTLPYFAGERTPLLDPTARGAMLGLTLDHTRGHIARSLLEATAFGVRHNLDTMTSAGATPTRLVGVGGGARSSVWPQIVADVTGLPQDIPEITLGASYGNARACAEALGLSTNHWNPVALRVEPNPSSRVLYDRLYSIYLSLYPTLRDQMHELASLG
jgi:xylulokinase